MAGGAALGRGHVLGETFLSLVHSSLYQLNPYIVNPLLYPWLQWIQVHALLPAVGIVMLVQLVFCLLAVKRGEPQNRWLWMVAGAPVILLVVSIGRTMPRTCSLVCCCLGEEPRSMLSPW